MRALRWTAFALIGLLLVAGPARPAGQKTLEIVSASGVHVFTIEIADTEPAREKGLMFRKNLPDGHGMLFDFKREQDVSFWMKNTYIPLDMFFIQGNGRILRIAENAKPLSTALLPSQGPVLAVLEVSGGIAHRLGIRPGDRVAFPIFKGN
jgi:uncharacterized membrane protein (UPF0127 family)